MCSMKKVLFSTVAMSALMLMATSCADDQTSDLKAGAESTVTITAQLPGDMGTRAFADGLTAKHLQYAVYEAGQSTPLKVFGDETTVVGEAEMVNLKKSVTLKLTSGKSYDVIFWADATTDSPYTFNPASQEVSVDYSKVNNNSDNCDAFFKKETITVSGNQSVDVQLTRPFAQVNIGTDDFDAAKASGLEVTQTEVVAKAFATLNLATGEVSDEADRTFTMKAIPTASDGEFPVAGGYKYLSMDYLLVGADKATVDVAFNYGGPQSRTFTNVPVQRNYRTNIYGSLLTNTADFNVVIVPGFNDPDYNHNVITASTQDELKTAAQTPNAVIKLKENTTYTLPKTVAEGVTFSGDETTVISIPQAIGYGGQTIGFSGVTVKSPNANYIGIQHAKAVTYTGCVIEGSPFSYTEKAVYNKCTFKQTSSGSYNIWTYGSKDITFNSCRFECAGKSVLIYNEGTVIGQNATFNNCEFIASAPFNGKAAIEVDSSLISGTFVININNCTATGFGTGSQSGNSLWNVKLDKTEKHHSQVFVDGTQVY